MGFDLGFFGDDFWTANKEDTGFSYTVPIKNKILEELEAENFDVTKNNLSSIKEFIEFFKMLLYFFSHQNQEMIEKCFSKLDYLGFSLNGHLEMTSEEVNDILNSMIQAAYLLYKENNEMNKMIYEHFYNKVLEMVKGE